MPLRVCFVCSGNICRSPTAEIVFAEMVRRAGLGEDVVIDSAGTGAWHAGDDMDARSRATLEAAGYQPPAHVAKQFTAEDFADRDLVVALDTGHHNVLWWLAAETGDAEAARDKIVMLRAFDPSAGRDVDVPDPYYGGRGGFTEVLDQVERACAGLLAHVRARLVGQQEDKPFL